MSFFTTKEAGKGTGLGLATVHGIVKQTGGAIRVSSAPGRGTTFTVYLAAVDHAAQARAAAPADEKVQDGTETVLLAEDDAAVRTLTRRMLTRRDYRVLEASDGAEARPVVSYTSFASAHVRRRC